MGSFNIAKVCKIMAFIIIIPALLMILSGLGILIDEGVNLISILLIVVGGMGTVLFIPCYALGEIIDVLYSININICKINKLPEKENQPKKEGAETKNSVALRLQKEVLERQEGWICKKCRTRNSSTAIMCKDCGAYK